MFYVQEFNARPGITESEMRDIYLRLAEGWSTVWPTNTFVGLFMRQFGLGPKPHFLAIWELPNHAAFDEWRNDWPDFDDKMQASEDEFWGAALDVESRVMMRVAPVEC